MDCQSSLAGRRFVVRDGALGSWLCGIDMAPVDAAYRIGDCDSNASGNRVLYGYVDVRVDHVGGKSGVS